eukprot:299440-Prorocentrum_minimum.AAC.6
MQPASSLMSPDNVFYFKFISARGTCVFPGNIYVPPFRSLKNTYRLAYALRVVKPSVVIVAGLVLATAITNTVPLVLFSGRAFECPAALFPRVSIHRSIYLLNTQQGKAGHFTLRSSKAVHEE